MAEGEVIEDCRAKEYEVATDVPFGLLEGQGAYISFVGHPRSQACRRHNGYPISGAQKRRRKAVEEPEYCVSANRIWKCNFFGLESISQTP